MKVAAFDLYLIAILPDQTERLKAINEFLEIWEITEKKDKELCAKDEEIARVGRSRPDH